ncbi:MAG: ABC transporter ATP-binding protein [Pseudomonadota bacterium]
MTAPIEIAGLTRRFGATRALDGIDLEVPAGAFCVLLGPSGCGKTTLLNIIGGFDDPDTGRLSIGGRDMIGVPAAQRPTTTVFQDYALFPHMTLAENVGFGLRMRGQSRARRAARAEAMLDLVGLAGQGAKRPAALSGGQRQRVALARALAVEPDVLLLDEPLGALDLNLRRQMQAELKAIQAKVGVTFVHVTHDQEEAMAIADLVVVMDAGRIEDAGPPERVYRAPRSRFAATFLGDMNMLPGRVTGGRVETVLGPLGDATALAEGTMALACIRPEHLSAAGHTTLAPLTTARIVDAVFQGTHRKLTCLGDSRQGTTLVAHLPATAAAAPGDLLTLSVDPEMVTVLPA